MKNEISNTLAQLKSIFLIPTSLQPKLQLLFLTMQQLFYILLINGITFRYLPIFLQNNGILLMYGLIISCFIKFSFNISLTSAFGLIVLQITLKSNGFFQIINNFILGILFLCELIDSIAFDVTSQCVQSQVRNIFKVINCILLKGNIILLSNIQSHTYLHLCSFSFFLLLFLGKDKSLTKRQEFGTIRTMFYIWAAIEHLRLFIGSFVFMGTSYFLIASLVVSQIIYYARSYCSLKVNFQQLLAKQEYLKLCFFILKYSFSGKYDENIEKSIKEIISDEELHGNVYGNQGLLQILIGMLNKKRSFQNLILIIEINIINGHFVSAMNMILKVKQQLHWYQFLNHIILSKIEYKLINRYERKTAVIKLIYQKQLRLFLSFQHKLNKSAKENLKLNNYFKKNVIQLSMIKKIGSKISKYQNEIHRLYEQTNKFFVASTQYYFSYLMKVKNDYQTAKHILCTYLISSTHLLDFELSSKIYLKLRIQDRRVIIEKVGFNCKELLSYSQKDLESQQIQKLIPSFYRNEHQKLSQSFIHQNIEEMCLFQKRTVILNSKQKYSQCNIVLKLNYFIDGFCFQGHIHVLQNEKYDLNRFFFLSDDGIILDANQKIFNQVQCKDHNIDQFIAQQQIGLPISQQYEFDIIMYDPILILKNNIGLIYFYAKRSQSHKQKQKNIITCKELEQANQLHQEKIQKDNYSSQIQELQKRIYNSQILILFALCTIFILFLILCGYLLIYSSKVKKNNQYMVVSNGQFLMQYYNNLFILAIDLTYLDLSKYLQYKNSFINVNLIQASLLLSHFNENLKGYNLGKYAIPSSNSLITYQYSNFEIVQMLATTSYTYQQFKNDSFLSDSSLKDFQELIFTLLVNSFTDYRISVLKQVSNYVQVDHYYDKVSLTLSLITVAIIIILVIRLYIKVKDIEKIALTYRCLTVKQTKINQILDFLYQLTLDNNQIGKTNKDKQFLDNEVILAPQTDVPFAKTQTSFVRQMSYRGLMQDTLNKSKIQTIQPNIYIEKNPKCSSFTDTKSYKYIIVVSLSIVGLLISLMISNQIINNNIKDVNQIASINSIITLYRASAFYSRAIIITFNTIILKQVRNVDNTKKYQQQINSYYTYLTQFTIPNFPETQFPEFSQYSQGYNQLYQQSICQYIPCRPQYQSQINLNFMTVINKLSTNLSYLVNETTHMNTSGLISFISSSQIRQYITILFETQTLLRDFTINLSMTYLSNYKSFMNNLFNCKMNFIIPIIVVTVIGLLLFLYLILYIRDEQAILIKIIKLYY